MVYNKIGFSGPSYSGKTVLARFLLQRFPDTFYDATDFVMRNWPFHIYPEVNERDLVLKWIECVRSHPRIVVDRTPLDMYIYSMLRHRALFPSTLDCLMLLDLFIIVPPFQEKDRGKPHHDLYGAFVTKFCELVRIWVPSFPDQEEERVIETPYGKCLVFSRHSSLEQRQRILVEEVICHGSKSNST